MGGLWDLVPDIDPKADIKRLDPLEIPVLELAQWKSNHHWSEFLHEPSTAEMGTGVAITMGLEVLGHAVEVLEPVGWLHIAYEILEASGRDDEAREAQLEAWNELMGQRFWNNDAAYPSASLREAAFDTLVGDNANHGIVPHLTEAAELEKQELIFHANERWLANIEVMEQAKKELDYHGPKAEAVHAELLARAAHDRKEADHYVLMDPARSERARRWSEITEDLVKGEQTEEDVYVHRARETMSSYEADLKAVMEVEANPANWDLTPDQKAMLHNLTSEMPEAPVSTPASDP